jgi:hypothetical protein
MEKNLVEHKMCVLVISTTFVWNIFLIVRRTKGDMIKHVYWSNTCYSCQVFNETWFSQQISKKNIQMSNFMKIRSAGAELSHAGGWTDRHATRRSSQFCERA